MDTPANARTRRLMTIAESAAVVVSGPRGVHSPARSPQPAAAAAASPAPMRESPQAERRPRGTGRLRRRAEQRPAAPVRAVSPPPVVRRTPRVPVGCRGAGCAWSSGHLLAVELDVASDGAEHGSQNVGDERADEPPVTRHLGPGGEVGSSRSGTRKSGSSGPDRRVGQGGGRRSCPTPVRRRQRTHRRARRAMRCRPSRRCRQHRTRAPVRAARQIYPPGESLGVRGEHQGRRCR